MQTIKIEFGASASVASRERLGAKGTPNSTFIIAKNFVVSTKENQIIKQYNLRQFTDTNSVICKIIVGTPVLGCPRTPQERCPYKHKPTIMNVGDDAYIVPPNTVKFSRADVGIRPYETSVKEIEK